MNAWLVLVLTDAVAVCSLARCFGGPGELTAALATLAAVHLVCRLARLRRKEGRVLFAMALPVAMVLPVLVVLGLSPAADAHLLATDMPRAWEVFRRDVAPVPELPGLVLLAAWVSGAVALLAEALVAVRRLPAVVPLLPALCLFLFADSLGSGSWRALELGAIADSSCWYLALAVRERAVTTAFATTDGGEERSMRGGSGRHGGRAIWKVSALAAVAAAVIGPNLPGARSAALVPIRGVTTSPGGTGNGGQQQTTTAQPTGVQVNTLVEVGAEEIDNPNLPLFTVYSSVPTREVLAVLDDFDGAAWRQASGPAEAVRRVSVPMVQDESSPPAIVQQDRGHARLVQVIRISGLGGRGLPDWGVASAVAGAGAVRSLGPSGSLVSTAGLTTGSTYAVVSEVADPSPAALASALAEDSDRSDLGLPGPVPGRLVRLAHGLVAGTASAYGEALDLEGYLDSSRFSYRLPTTATVGASSSSQGYGALDSFLFDSRTGDCQQFASAFAVLARIDGLPTRIVVGFLPGNEVGHDRWQVDGSETHAWPQVLFQGYGWINFEPTPGAPGVSGPVPSRTTTTTGAVPTSTTKGGSGHPGAGGGGSSVGSTSPGSRPYGAPWVPWLVVPAALALWVAALAVVRSLRRRRLRDEPGRAVLAAWDEAARTLGRAGLVRGSAETHLELARRAAASGALSPEAERALEDLAGLLASVCYGPLSAVPSEAQKALEDALEVIRGAALAFSGLRRLVSVLDPRAIVV